MKGLHESWKIEFLPHFPILNDSFNKNILSHEKLPLTLLYVSSNLSIFVQDKLKIAIIIDSLNFTHLHYKTFRQMYLCIK